MLRRLFALAAVVAAFFAPALADDAAPVRVAHPALWTVHSSAGTAYLFGSIHVLPPNVNWRSDAIETALKGADALVFEIPIDPATQAAALAYVAKNGMLPPDQSLRALLPPELDAKYDKVVAASGLPPASVDRMEPWLASLVLTVATIRGAHYDPMLGPDMVLQTEAAQDHKPILAFETIEQQLALIAPSDRKTGIESLASTLDDIIDEPTLTDDLLAAWAAGDTNKLAALLNGNIDKYPGARKALLDDRNKAWVKQLKVLLKKKQTYFVTVGAGHLVGPLGVPALLRKEGYQVDGP